MKTYKKASRICVLDTETTDRYWNTSAPIQIAAMIIDERGDIIDGFNERIKTTHVIADTASAVHGIYAKDLVNCRGERDVLEDFCSWMLGNEVDLMLTYNGDTFDRPLLNCRCQKLGINFDYFDKDKFPGEDAKVDVFAARKLNLFNLKDLGRKWKLTLVAEKLNFSTDNAHDALADCRMLRDVWMTLDPMLHPENWEDSEDSDDNSLLPW